MPRRIPLYTKILAWFFLNLVLLAAVFLVMARAQFRFGMDVLLSNRFDSVSEIIGSELGAEPRAEWAATLKHFSNGYQGQVQFLVFGNDGFQLAGEALTLPDEVRQQLEHRHNQPPGPAPDESPEPPREPPPHTLPGPPRQFIHTGSPSRYWAIRRVPVKEQNRGRPGPVTLIAVSDSLAGGGLFFESSPLVAVGAGAIILSVLLWFPFVQGMTRSIRQMTAAANRIADGHFDVRVDETRRDELGALGTSVNQMAGRLNDLVSGQKRFLGDVAHELVSPLAKLRVTLAILEQQAAGSQRAYVAGAEEEAAHMASLVNELLSFSRASLTSMHIELRPVRLLEVAERAARRESTAEATIDVQVPAELMALAEPELLTRALANLLRNAVRHAGAAGPILLRAQAGDGEIILTVADAGPGVPEVELSRIFDPFYRVDPSRDRATGGVGLGLAIVKTCVDSCGGTVSARNRTPSGLEVTLRLKQAA